MANKHTEFPPYETATEAVDVMLADSLPATFNSCHFWSNSAKHNEAQTTFDSNRKHVFSSAAVNLLQCQEIQFIYNSRNHNQLLFLVSFARLCCNKMTIDSERLEIKCLFVSFAKIETYTLLFFWFPECASKFEREHWFIGLR